MSVADLHGVERYRGFVPAVGAFVCLVLFANAVALAALAFLGGLDPYGIAGFTLPPVAVALLLVAAVALTFAAVLTLFALLSH